MHVGIGYADTPDTRAAGATAAQHALDQAGQPRPCDLVLLFATARHNPETLREAVATVVGPQAYVVGGSAIGVITGSEFGYAGDQVGLAAFWLDGVGCDVVAEGGTTQNEEEVGQRIGNGLALRGITPETSAVLLYDAIDRSQGDVRLHLATPLLHGIESTLGFLPNLVGAGLQGDYECSPAHLWIGAETVSHHALALAFTPELRIDSVILHGCRPSGEHFKVTKAEKQTVLEIDGQPALPFIEAHSGLPAEEFPFFMIFGVNHGDPNGPFNENHYANRLCLAIDRARNGIVMFESDMVAGTEFQIMYRSLDFEYMAPKINQLFDGIGDRRPVFAFYINCAGRAARYAGDNLEDSVVVQQIVADRAPLLGIYSGVEIAPVLGLPRTLDWTGVLCLFSVDPSIQA